MNTIPYRLNIQGMANILNQKDFIKNIPLLNNLFQYLKDGLICASDLIELGKLAKIPSNQIAIAYMGIDDEEKLFSLSNFIAIANKFGFVRDFHLIRKIANSRLEQIYNEKFKY